MLRRRAKHGPIGLDLGAAALKLVQFADMGGKPALVATAHYDLSEAMDDPERREAAILEALRDALRTRGFIGRDVVAALGSGEFQMKNVRLPRMPEAEMAGAVEFEAHDRFELQGRTAQIRHLPAGEVRHGNEIKEELIVFAALDEVVEQRLALLESVGLQLVALDLAPCAVARSFVRFLRRAEDANAVNVFIDVGWRGTSIVITHGTEIVFLKMLDIGGQHFTEAVTSALNLNPRQAFELRVRRMSQAGSKQQAGRSSVPPEMDAAVTDAIRTLVERMVRDIQLCLRYFAVTFRGQRPECLTFVGGEACEPALIKIVSEEIDVPCLIGHPLRGIELLSVMLGKESTPSQAAMAQQAARQAPSWAAACGLALRGSSWVRPHGAHLPGSLPSNVPVAAR